MEDLLLELYLDLTVVQRVSYQQEQLSLYQRLLLHSLQGLEYSQPHCLF